MNQIVTSMLDTDYYSFTVGQAVHQHFPFAHAQYRLTIRTPVAVPTVVIERFKASVRQMTFGIAADELAWLRAQMGIELTIPYHLFLKDLRFNPELVKIGTAHGPTGYTIDVRIEGPAAEAVLWEVPLLATLSQLWHEFHDGDRRLEKYQCLAATRTKDLYRLIKSYAPAANLTEFGTRRRYSMAVQRAALQSVPNLPTSNCALAKELGRHAVGTLSHQWYMYHSAFHHPEDVNLVAQQCWAKMYANSMALPDTFGSDLFFRHYDRMPEISGFRQDSGSPLKFIERFKYNLARPNRVLFSDNLNYSKVEEILISEDIRHVQPDFAVGTYLTNPSSNRLNMVIKLYEVDGRKVVKLSDEPGKAVGHPDAIRAFNYLAYNKPLDS